MHRTFLAALYLTITLPVMAQEPMLHATSIWSEHSGSFDGINVHTMTYDHLITGDTTINSIDYFKVQRNGVDSIYSMMDGTTIAVPIDLYIGAIREDILEMKWYVVFSGQETEVLLYDFDLAIGEVITGTHGDCSSEPTVVAADQVIINGELRNRYLIDPWSRYIIEGVGANTGLFGYLCMMFESGSCLDTYAIEQDVFIVDGCTPLSVSVQEVTVDSFRSYPNPTTDNAYLVYRIPDGVEQVQLRLTDPFGRMILERSFAGQYGINELSTGQLSTGLYLGSLYFDGIHVGSTKIQVVR